MGIFIEKILNYLSRICLKKELCKYNESSLLNFHQQRTRSTYVYTGFQKKKKKSINTAEHFSCSHLSLLQQQHYLVDLNRITVSRSGDNKRVCIAPRTVSLFVNCFNAPRRKS